MPPPLRRSSHLQAHKHTNAEGLHSAFLSEFAPLRDSHTLLPLDFMPSDFPSVDVFLSSISDGSAKPNFDSGDDPSWSEAMCSPEREYWIGGAHNELRSLAHMHVFVLVPCCYVLGATQGAFFIFHLLTKPFPSRDQPPIHIDHMTNHLTKSPDHPHDQSHAIPITCSQVTCASPDTPSPDLT